MAFSDLFKGNVATTLLIGVGALVLAPVVLPAVSRIGRPLLRGVIKSGITLYNEVVKEIDVKSLVADARTEIEETMEAEVEGELESELATVGTELTGETP